MSKPYRKFLTKSRRLGSSSTLAYLRKWLPAAVLIGIAAGVASIAFFSAITWATKLFLGLGTGFIPPFPLGEEGTAAVGYVSKRWMIPVITTVGGLISGLLIYRLAPEAESQGTDAAINAFHRNEGLLRPRIPVLELVASAVIIGSGGSAGQGGPTALITAACGSLVGRWFRLNTHDLRLAVTIGIGTGIGSIFKAPLGGALLSAEILYLQGFEVEALVPSFVSTIVGYSIYASWLGFTPMFGQNLGPVLAGPETLLSYAILGVLCGLVGILFTRTFYGVRYLFRRLTIPKHYRPAIGGLVTGLIGLALPQVLGTSYGWLQLAMTPAAIPLLVMIALIFAKIVATSFSVGSGGSGGVFAPGFVIGGMLAASLWAVSHSFAESYLPSSPQPFVAVGMMALFGAVAHAPIAVIIMVSEMSGSYAILLPAMIAVGLAYVVVGRDTIFESQVPSLAHSPAHTYEYVSPLLNVMKVHQAMIADCSTVSPSVSIEKAAQVIENCGVSVPVVGERGELMGIVAKEDILPTPAGERGITNVGSVMSTDLVVTYPEETLERALELIISRSVAVLPVVDRGDRTRLLGLVTRRSIIQAYESEAQKMLKETQS
jgi:CIC family chloride channel protein